MTSALERTSDIDLRTPPAAPTSYRLAGASGAAYAILILVGNGIYSEGGSRDLGFAIEMLGYLALGAFVAYAATTMRARAPWASALALVGGAGVLAVKLGAWSASLAAETAEASVATALIAVDDAAWALGWVPQGLFVVGLASAALVARRLPKVLAWAGIVIGGACAVAVLIPGEEPFPVPFLLSLLWIIVASIVLTRGEFRRDGEWAVEV